MERLIRFDSPIFIIALRAGREMFIHVTVYPSEADGGEEEDELGSGGPDVLLKDES